MKVFFIFIGVALSVLSCQKTDDQQTVSNLFHLEYNGLPIPNLPEDNVLTNEGVELGRWLFYDKRLSEDESLSCASCHAQANAFSDTNQFSIGVKGLSGKRQAMGIFNMAWNTNGFFWDGRAEELRIQALMPIQDHLEMNLSILEVVNRLSLDANYKERFNTVFQNGQIDSINTALALEQFMFSIVSNKSKYDLMNLGKVEFTEEEQRGMVLFLVVIMRTIL